MLSSLKPELIVKVNAINFSLFDEIIRKLPIFDLYSMSFIAVLFFHFLGLFYFSLG